MREAVLLLDEIQVVSGWERFVRRLLDSEKADIFLSGSSATSQQGSCDQYEGPLSGCFRLLTATSAVASATYCGIASPVASAPLWHRLCEPIWPCLACWRFHERLNRAMVEPLIERLPQLWNRRPTVALPPLWHCLPCGI